MFALFHADEMPLLEWGDVSVERIAGSTYRVKAEIRNTRAIPTRIEAAELYSSGVPDLFSRIGPTVDVHSSSARIEYGIGVHMSPGSPVNLPWASAI